MTMTIWFTWSKTDPDVLTWKEISEIWKSKLRTRGTSLTPTETTCYQCHKQINEKEAYFLRKKRD